MNNTVQPIDIVIAWVDGNDPLLNQKRMQYQNKNLGKDALKSTLFANNNEIYFCIASILKYMPYIGKIYVLTDKQKPKWLDQFFEQGLVGEGKIQIVDHVTLFKGYEDNLPTFNAVSIESLLWNIEFLSNRFIYMNDDFFINSPSQLDDFIDGNKIVVYGHWKSNLIKKIKYLIRRFMHDHLNKKAAYRYTTAQMLSADMVGLNKYFEVHHRPHVFDKKVLRNYFQEHPQILSRQIKHKFRHIDQFLPIGLLNHLIIQSEQAILKPDVEIAYLKDKSGIAHFIQQLDEIDVKYGCIQSLDQFDEDDAKYVMSKLYEKFKNFLPTQIQHTKSI